MSSKKNEAPTPQSQINTLLGTSNKAEQLARIAVLLGSQPATLVITANPASGNYGLSTSGAPSFKLLYEMLDFARDGVMEREKRALLEAVSQKDPTSPEE